MENSKVVIRLIVHGQKLYITNVQQSSYSFKLSKKPFSDNEVLKFNPDDAFKFVKGIQWSYPNKEVQIIDITGKTLNDVNGVINEEIKSFLTEGYVFKDDKLRFQQVINADFYNYQSFSTDYDADIPRAPITVNWSINFWLNQNGVESFNVEIDGVEGYYTLLLLDKQTDETKQESMKNIAEIEWHYKINDIAIEGGGTLYISGIDFDFKNKICNVTF